MAGWERHFVLDWTVEREQSDARRLRATSTTSTEESAENVRLLAQALDASGAVIGQRITWVPERSADRARLLRGPHLRRRPLSADGLDYTFDPERGHRKTEPRRASDPRT